MERMEAVLGAVSLEYYVSLAEDSKSKPTIFIVAGQHAREWNAIEIAQTYVANWTAAGNPDANVVVVPVANPSGYNISKTVKRMQRGNASGVDLNRNFDAHFKQSPPTYDKPWSSGPCAGSEPETKLLLGVFERYPPTVVLNLHCYGRLIVVPHGWTTDLCPEYPFMYQCASKLQRDLEQNMKRNYTVLPFRKLYEGHGCLIDWCYEHKIFAFTVEFGASFKRHPPTIEHGAAALRCMVDSAAAFHKWSEVDHAMNRKELRFWTNKVNVGKPYRGYMHLKP